MLVDTRFSMFRPPVFRCEDREGEEPNIEDPVLGRVVAPAPSHDPRRKPIAEIRVDQ
jgi:hypothetical protein